MTSRERVLAVFSHREPDRVPMWFGASPEFIAKARRQLDLESAEDLLVRLGDDFRRVHARYAGPAERNPFDRLPGGASCRTMFNVIHRGVGCGMPVDPPLAGATIEEVENYCWPDPDWIDVGSVRPDAERWEGRYAILGGDWAPFWHDANELLGMENLMIKMVEEPALVEALFEHVATYYYEVNRRILAEAGHALDVVFIGNDFGAQAGPLIGEPMFRQFVFPHLRRLTSLAHQHGLPVMMHCCGGFAPLIPALLDAGVDALQALQPSARGMDPAELKAAFGGRLVFNGCIDSQRVLIEGTPGLVRDTVRATMNIMKPGGGYVLSASHDFILEETPVENVVAMFDAGKEFGAYS